MSVSGQQSSYLPAAPAPSATPLNITTTIRVLLLALGSAGLVKTGIIGNDQLQTIVSSLMILGSVAWSYYKNHRVTQKLGAAMTAAPVRLVPPSAVPPPLRAFAFIVALLLLGVVGRGITACNAISPPPSVSLLLLQGDTSLDVAYDTALRAYIKIAPSLPASVKATARVLIPKISAAVETADKAESTADAATFAAQVASAQALIGQLTAITAGASAGATSGP